MTDLHKPLGTEQSKKDSAGASRILFGAVTLGLIGLAGFGIWRAIQPDRSVVSLNDAKVTAEQPKQAKPVPLPKDDGEVVQAKPQPQSKSSQSSKIDQPVFKPKKITLKKRDPWVPLPELLEQSEFGLLPKVASDGLRPMDAYSQSPETVGGVRIAIVLGGLGLSQTGTKKAIEALPSSVTLAYSPSGNSLQRWMQAARKEGHEVALQLAMEPLGYPQVDPGRGTLVSTDPVGQNLKNLRWSLGRMTNYPVVMNYLGANFTNKPEALRPVLEEIKNRGLGWLDDGSVPTSKSLDMAEAMRLPNASGNVVLDGQPQAARIQAQFKSLEFIAKRRGYAIATASAFPESVRQIVVWVREAEKRGIQIVPLSNLLRDYSRQ